MGLGVKITKGISQLGRKIDNIADNVIDKG